MEHNAAAILRRVFSGLSDEELTKLANVAQLRTYAPGTVLCDEGCIEDTFYVIVDGRAEVSKRVEEDTERVLHRPGPGEFFGEIALVQGGPRTATVRLLESTTVLELKRAPFLSVLQRSAPMAMRIMQQVTSRLRDGDRRAIADLRRKNIELAQAYEKLEVQQRLRSQLLTNIAHELRTPLTTAVGYLHLVNSDAAKPEQTEKFLERVQHSLETIIHLVNNILFLQELELIKPEFELLELERIVHQAVREVTQAAVQAGLTIRTTAEDQLPQIRGDSVALNHAVVALLDNAIKFSPDGGEIRIRMYAEDSVLRLEIRDPGVGFPMEQLDDLFEPFTRIESSGEYLFGGLGLGLPTIKQVVESHGGQIEVESEVGRGSTFVIAFPTAERTPG